MDADIPSNVRNVDDEDSVAFLNDDEGHDAMVVDDHLSDQIGADGMMRMAASSDLFAITIDNDVAPDSR